MKTASLVFTLALTSGLLLAACNKGSSGEAPSAAGGSVAHARRSEGKSGAAALLTKEEVGAILGKPVTSIEGKGTHLTYKTDEMLLETSIELDQKDDSVQSMKGARTATGFLGGAPEEVPGLGDEAFFGAMSFLYLRKGDSFVTITPPNFQMMAGMKAGERLREAKLGSDEQVKALEALQQVEKTDPATAGLQGGNAMQGALAVVNASSKKQGTEYETHARAVAVALATKLLEKL
jgi:hypothetical protein